MSGPKRVVLTGGPGGGKTTAADLFRRELVDQVVVVPESATLLFSGGFPRLRTREARRHAQHAIFTVQKHLEEVQAATHPDRVLLCDRGTVDGAAYWPEDPHTFFAAMGTTLVAELARYDAVLFFESAAVGGHGIEGGNRVRTEDTAEAAELDRRLRELWSQHPNFTLVPHDVSFLAKVNRGVEVLDRIVGKLTGTGPRINGNGGGGHARGETSPGETGPGGTGPAEAGPAEAGPAEAGLAEAGPGKTGPGERAYPTSGHEPVDKHPLRPVLPG